MNALVPILVAIFNTVGPAIVQLIQQAVFHPSLDDNGKAAVAALHGQLERDRADLAAEAKNPLPVPDPKPTAPTRG